MAAGSQYGTYQSSGYSPTPPPPPPQGGGATWTEPAPQQQAPPPPVQPPAQQEQRRARNSTGALFGPKVGGIMVLMGVLLFFIGTIVVQSMIMVEEPDYDDYEYDEMDKYDKDRDKYEDTMRNIFGFGRILSWAGAMALVLPLFVIGVSGENLEWKVRASMLTTGTAIIIATMIVGWFYGFPYL